MADVTVAVIDPVISYRKARAACPGDILVDGDGNPIGGGSGGLNYLGLWDASTNTPTLVSGGSGEESGDYYIVSVAGNTPLDGISDWTAGDWVIFNGTAWQKIDAVESVTSIFGRQGDVVAVSGDYDLNQIGSGTIAELNTIISDLTATYGGIRDIGVGTIAQRPAFGVANRFFYTIDTTTLYLDTGSAWVATTSAVGLHAATHEDGGSDEISVAGLSGELADNQPPKTHASSHQNGGADEVGTATPAANVIPKADGSGTLDSFVSDASTTVKGKVELATDGESAANVVVQGNDSRLSDARTPTTHAATHENGGSDEISVLGLSGLLADNQNPTNHASTHTDGTTDDIQDASASQKGLLTSVAQTVGGQKTFDTAPRITPLNTGDRIITTDTNGELQESDASIETGISGGSLIKLTTYTTDPVSPDDGDSWYLFSGGLMYHKHKHSGTIYSVVMGAE
jgi:hypothetical protein